MIVRVVAADMITPVNGATVAWSTTNGATLSTCNGASNCSAVTNESGLASSSVTPTVAGNASIAAEVAPAVYNPAQTVVATITTSPPLPTNIAVTTPYLSIAQGASLTVPLTAQVVNQSGAPLTGVTVNFFLGSASSPFASAVTGGNGYATVTLALTNFATEITVSACVGQANNPCQNINVYAVSQAQLNLQPVAGVGQIVTGSAFQPLIVRVTDSSPVPNPVLAASVLFQSTVLRPVGKDPIPQPSTSSATQTAMPIILGSTQVSVQSDGNGLASFVPSSGAFTGPLEIEIQVSAGTTAALQDVMETFPESSIGNTTLH